MLDLLKKLNKEQQTAVTHGDGPVLIVAGAGTGKTTVITSRIAWLILEKKIKTDEILALTFTEKASTEMEERVEKFLPYGYLDLWISTFHSFCDRILKQHALDIGLPSDYKLLNQTEQWMLLRKNLDKFNLDYYRPLGNSTKFIHALLIHFSRCKDEEISQQQYLEYVNDLKINLDRAISSSDKLHNTNKKEHISDDQKFDLSEINRLNEIANAYHVYQQLLLDNNMLDYGDLVNYTLKLFRERPVILKNYQDKFKYILVDEFQDTNWAQYELIKLLLNKDQNLTIVGDDDQAIYKFRGASVSNILSFLKDFPKAQKIVLNQNYRSTQEILDLSYDFIQLNNPNRLECVGASLAGTHDDVELSPAMGAPTLCINKKLKSNSKEKSIIEHLEGKNLEEEVSSVIDKIIKLKTEDKDATWSDFAILSRANNTVLPFVEKLENNNIPFVYYSLRGLYNKTAIMNMIALFKLLDNYHESTALYKALNIPEFKVNYSDLIQLLHFAKKKAQTLFSVINKIDLFNDIKDESRKNIKKLLSLIEKYSSFVDSKKISEIYLGILQDSQYLKRLANHDSKENKEQLDYLQQFYSKIKEFENSTQSPTLKLFLEEFFIELESGESGSLQLDLDVGPEMVRVMTIHSAKGLEFKYVFIVGMVDKRFPTIERKDPIKIPDELIKEILPEGDIHLQEERRLFYVAMTRAKKGLFFSSAKDYGGAREKKVSQFLFDVGMGDKKEELNNPVPKNDLTIRKEAKLPAGSLASDSGLKKVITKPEYQIPKRFSFSQLAAFDKCPLQYKYTFLLKIPIHGKGVFSFGKTMHSTLQKLFERVKQGQGGAQINMFNDKVKSFIPSIEELMELYKESWVDAWYADEKTKKEYKNKGKQVLKDFYKIHQGNWPSVEYLEKGFNLKIGDYIVRGVIDRVDKIEDGIEIVDYKTGEVKDIKKLSTNDKAQLLLYQIASEEVFGLDPKKLTFYYLNENKQVSFLGSDKEKEKLKEKIISQIEAIKKSNFEATPSMLCKYCDYFDICEYRQL